MAAWAPLVPFAKERIGLNDASLGLLLLCIGVGSMLAMPLTGVLTANGDAGQSFYWQVPYSALTSPYSP